LPENYREIGDWFGHETLGAAEGRVTFKTVMPKIDGQLCSGFGLINGMSEKTLITLLAVGALGYLMLSDPHCNRGCRTVGEHLLSHAIDDLLLGLFGV